MVKTEAGTVINVSDTQFGGRGVYISLASGTAATVVGALTANVASTIIELGPASIDPNNFPSGIFASPWPWGCANLGELHRSGHYNQGRERSRHLMRFPPVALSPSIPPGRSIRRTAPTQSVSSPTAGHFSVSPQQATVTVNATDVLTMGQFGTAIGATARR